MSKIKNICYGIQNRNFEIFIRRSHMRETHICVNTVRKRLPVYLNNIITIPFRNEQ